MTVLTETPPPPAINPEAEIQIAILDVSQARLDNARDMADARLTAETDSTTAGGGRLRNLVRKIWKGNIANDYYRQKYTHEALNQIDQTGDIYANEDHAKSREAVGAVVNRFTDMYSSDLVHEGETRQELANDPENDIQKAVKNLVGAYARDELNENSFEEEKNRVLRELAKQNPGVFKKGMAFADNLLNVAQNVKAQIAHGKGVDEIMSRAKFVVGEARMGVRSEANFNRVDRVVDRLHKTKIGSLVNESTIAAAASIVSSITKMGTRREVGQALALTGVMGVAGAAIAGARESKKFKQERNQHMRESAMGQVFKAEAKRRSQLEQARYETKGAKELASELHGLFDDEGKLKPSASPDDYVGSVKKLVEARMRTKMSDTQNIDLIHYSELTSVEQERFDLDLAMAKAKVALRKEHEDKGDAILPPGIKTMTFDQLLATFDTAFSEGQTSEIAQRNKVFEKMRRKEVAKAAGKGFLIGAGVGFMAQEAMSLLPVIGEGFFGVGAHPSSVITPGRNNHTTMLHGLVHGNEAGTRELPTSISSRIVEAPKGGIMHDVTISDKAHISLPEGYTAAQNGANQWDIKSPEGVKLTTVDLNADGTISNKSLDLLATKGVGLKEGGISPEALNETTVTKIGNDSYVLPKGYSLQVVTGPPGAETNHWQVIGPDGKAQADFHIDFDGSVNAQGLEELKNSGLNFDITAHADMMQVQAPSTTMSANELIWNNAAQTERVHRTLWYGNNTPGDYDLNELRTHAGGVDGSWFDQNGNVVIDVSRMTPDGSFQGGQEANPFQLTGDNKLALAVSLTKESQDTIFKYDFITTPDGRTQAIIPPDSPIYQLFKTDANGERVFNGRYFEVMEMTGQQDEYGQQVKVLGTFVGHSNTDNLVGTVDQAVPIETHVNTLVAPREQVLDFSGFKYAETTTTKNVLVAPGNVVPMVPIPLRARRGLEAMKKTPETSYTQYGLYGGESFEDLEELLDTTMPVLHENPRARVPLNEATAWYEELLRKKRSREYVDSVMTSIESSPVLSTLSIDTKAIVTLPVAAISEGDNIYSALSLYAQQSAEDINSTTVLLNLNWPEARLSEAGVTDRIQHTRDEIARAQAEFPNLKIAVIESQLTPDEVSTGIVGHVVRRLYDTAILAVNKSINEGRIQPDQEVTLIRNDADSKGISSNYIGRMVDATQRDGVDASVGRLKWGIEQTKDLPGFNVAVQVLEGIRGSAQRARDKGIETTVQTSGANTGVRLSSLAAVGSIGFGAGTGAGTDDLMMGWRINAVRGVNSPLRAAIYGRRHGSLKGYFGFGRNVGSGAYDDIGGEGSTISIAGGATIDTDPSRLEALYRIGRPIGAAWDDFDEDGFKPRDAVMPDVRGKESLSNMTEVADRIEMQINYLLKDWRIDPQHAEMEFRRSFPSNRDGEEPMYEYTTNPDGSHNFKFTPSGVTLLQKRITRNNRGRYDPLGSRRVRVNYGRTAAGGRIEAPRTPRLVEAL